MGSVYSPVRGYGGNWQLGNTKLGGGGCDELAGAHVLWVIFSNKWTVQWTDQMDRQMDRSDGQVRWTGKVDRPWLLWLNVNGYIKRQISLVQSELF
jgi:hypothetical protein